MILNQKHIWVKNRCRFIKPKVLYMQETILNVFVCLCEQPSSGLFRPRFASEFTVLTHVQQYFFRQILFTPPRLSPFLFATKI